MSSCPPSSLNTRYFPCFIVEHVNTDNDNGHSSWRATFFFFWLLGFKGVFHFQSHPAVMLPNDWPGTILSPLAEMFGKQRPSVFCKQWKYQLSFSREPHTRERLNRAKVENEKRMWSPIVVVSLSLENRLLFSLLYVCQTAADKRNIKQSLCQTTFPVRRTLCWDHRESETKCTFSQRCVSFRALLTGLGVNTGSSYATKNIICVFFPKSVIVTPSEHWVCHWRWD